MLYSVTYFFVGNPYCQQTTRDSEAAAKRFANYIAGRRLSHDVVVWAGQPGGMRLATVKGATTETL